MNDNALKFLRETYADAMFGTVIRKNIALSEAISKSKSIFDYKAESKGAEDYNNLAMEIITRVNVQQIKK